MDPAVVAALVATAVFVGAGATALVAAARRRGERAEARRHIDDARREADRLTAEAAQQADAELRRRRELLDEEVAELRKEAGEQARRLDRREQALDRRAEQLERREQLLESHEARIVEREEACDAARAEIDDLAAQHRQKLTEIAHLDEATARDELLAGVRDDLATEEAELIQRMEERVREHAEEKARWVISQAIHRVAGEHTTEAATATVDLPRDDVKGRIIGRDGRNIRAFEKAAGVDVLVDDTPGIVAVSTFDSVRREIARLSLEKLIQDGRIHPARIEEVVAATRKEVEATIRERGRQVQFEADVHRIHPRLQELLGRLMFRTSYGQNVLLHSVEVAHILGLMAAEMGLDPKLGRRCGLLHDIGKALDQDHEGAHPELGMEIARKHGEPPEVLEAIGYHHDTTRGSTIWPTLTSAADAISASRPGARRDSFDRYLKRLSKLEEVATRIDGVEQAYAVQAGRELRVIVNDHRIDDAKAAAVARQIANDIEDELTYPGEIRVTLIRERRITEVAR
jgi:ribonuclease Y